jgi:hypothetical protein
MTLSADSGQHDLIGGSVGDLIMQHALSLNAAAGSLLDGGNGSDTIIFDGSQAYTADYVTIRGGNGNDLIKAGLGSGEYIGSMKIEAGPGNDKIQIGHVEGGSGYIDAGSGDDIIQFRGDWAQTNGIWGNWNFRLLGNAGDDTFILTGTQVNVIGDGTGALLSGDAGFDTLDWDGQYNLTINGHQNPDVGLLSGYKQELNVVNIEHIDVASTGASDMHFVFTPSDVEKITAGSDFDQSTLGLGLANTGHALFIDPGQNSVDPTGWELLGDAAVHGHEYQIYTSGADVLGLFV